MPLAGREQKGLVSETILEWGEYKGVTAGPPLELAPPLEMGPPLEVGSPLEVEPPLEVAE